MTFNRPNTPWPGRRTRLASETFRSRPTPLATALQGLLFSLAIGAAGLPQPAHAQAAATALPAGDAVRTFNVPAGPLDAALDRFARSAGVNFSYDSALIAGLTTKGLNGSYSIAAGLSALLTGSGVEAVPRPGGGYALRKVPEAARAASAGGQSETTLAAVSVRASAEALPGELPPPYAGGQVARGGRVGILGNKDVLETPFSQTSYTAEHIKDTQALRLGDVLDSSPSIQRVGGRFYSNDGYFIRGFSVFGQDISYDGLYGLSNVRQNAIEGIERVELLKGPSALLNGVPPNGAIGGNVNLVPKRALDTPITQATLSYLSDSTFGGHVDLGRRFGEGNAFGVRVNLAHRAGNTPYDYNKEKASLASIALDYRGDKLRLYANLNYEYQHMDAPIFSNWRPANASVPVPRAPDARTNPSPPWTFTETERSYHVVRAEYDLSEHWTASLAHGWNDVNETQLVAYGRTLINAAGDVTEPTANRFIPTQRDNSATDFKLSGHLQTGAVSHQVALGVYRSVQDSDYTLKLVGGKGSISNIYNLTYNYPLPSFVGVAGTRSRTRAVQDGTAVSDILGFFDDRLQLTVGARHQSLRSEDLLTGTTSYDKSATTPAVAVLGRVTDRLSVYANYIEGLTQAPTPPATAANFQQIFSPAKSKQKEVGVKFEADRLMTTVSLFEITQPSGTTAPSTNVFSLNGEQRNRGIEIEAYGELVRGLRLLGGVTYLDPKLIKTQNGSNDGKLAPNVSQRAASLGAEWDIPGVNGLTATGRVVHNSSRYLDAANTWEMPGWTRIDIGARYSTRLGGNAVTYRGGITNLLDKNYWESANSGLVLGPPRMFSLSATVDF